MVAGLSVPPQIAQRIPLLGPVSIEGNMAQQSHATSVAQHTFYDILFSRKEKVRVSQKPPDSVPVVGYF
jgi:hypothetical protein